MNRWMQLLTVGSLAFAAGTWQQDVARRTPGPAIESFVLSDLIAQGQWKPLPEPWVLEPSSHQLQQGSAVVLRDVRRSGDELALTVWTGLEGYENNVVTLRFVFDPVAHHLCALRHGAGVPGLRARRDRLRPRERALNLIHSLVKA